MPSRRVLVCGSRGPLTPLQAQRVVVHLDAELYYRPFDVLIQGGATGVDAVAKDWGKRKGLCVVTCDAGWGVHGKAAGPIRNALMLFLHPHTVLAFPGGPGTANMVKQAEKAGVPIKDASDGVWARATPGDTAVPPKDPQEVR